MFHVLLIWTSLKDVVRERERKLEAIPSASSRYHQREREREREKEKKILAVARLLLLTSNLLSTSIDRLQ